MERGEGREEGEEGERGVDTVDVLVPLASGATFTLINPSKSRSQVKQDLLLWQQGAGKGRKALAQMTQSYVHNAKVHSPLSQFP